jgi:hypothetical protein
MASSDRHHTSWSLMFFAQPGAPSQSSGQADGAKSTISESIIDPRKLANSRSASAEIRRWRCRPRRLTITYSPSTWYTPEQVEPPAGAIPRTPWQRHPLTVRDSPDPRLTPAFVRRQLRPHGPIANLGFWPRGGRQGTRELRNTPRESACVRQGSKESLDPSPEHFTDYQELDTGLATRSKGESQRTHRATAHGRSVYR